MVKIGYAIIYYLNMSYHQTEYLLKGEQQQQKRLRGIKYLKATMNKFTLIKNLLRYDGKTISLSNDFVTKDLAYFVNFVKNITMTLIYLSKLSDKGYVNKPNVDLPILLWFLKEFKLIKSNSITNYSIGINTFFFNLVLLLLLITVMNIEKHCLLKTSEEGYLDLKTDLATIRKQLLRMIHPNFRAKITKRGLSVILNSLVGYDSEYELNSSIRKTNDLLSIQLAGSTGLVLKVPLIDKRPVTSSYLNNNLTNVFKGDEKKIGCIFCASIEKVISDIRSVSCEDNDNLIERLILKLETLDLKSYVIDGYKVYSFPKSEVKSFIKYTNEYTSKDLITDSDSLNNVNNENSLLEIIGFLNDVCGIKHLSSRMKNSIKNSSNKSLSRITYKHGLSRLSITINRMLTICMHESAADLSMLKDFETFKENLDIVHRSFVTLGKPLTLDWCNSKVHFRDTILLAPAGVKSLAGVGSIYGDEFKKIDIGSYRSGKMRELLKDNKELFEKYAIQDSIITLKHASSMEDFYLSVNKIGVPLTLSSIGKSYVIKEWSLMGYKGYQPRLDMSMGNLSGMLNPKGARSIDLLNYIVPFVAGYRGGRNESYMYGVDDNLNNRQWIDYDLTSCYTTVMSMLGDPDYKRAAYVFNKTIEKMNYRDLLLNYIMVDVDFKFPDNVKYPCIPTRVDDDIDIYPKQGRSTITGCEYFVAKSMGCRLHVRTGVIVPFKKDESKKSNNTDFDTDYLGPFKSIVKELQCKRRQFEKKTFYNYMYKEIGNSVYGQIAMGISGRTTYDIKTKNYVKIQGGLLANPILAGYITGFTRALIGECMNNIQELGGIIISTTTDGFITDVDDLENKILGLENNRNKERFYCLKLYRLFRDYLTTFENSESDPRALEIKNIEISGIITVKTRAQLGFTKGGISAITGFQTRNIDKTFLIEEFSNILKNDDNKVIEYVQTGLRSASDIYKNNGHVIATYKDRSFSVEYDNKRCILDPNKNYYLYRKGLLDSKPWNNVIEYAKIRVLKDTITKPVFVKGIVSSQSKSYKSYIETSVRGFVKACLSENVNKRYGIPIDWFSSYKSIIDFIHGYEPAREVKLSYSSMSNLKYRNTISRTVPRTTENEGFIAYVKDNIVDFKTDLFFKELSDESIREANKQTKVL